MKPCTVSVPPAPWTLSRVCVPRRRLVLHARQHLRASSNTRKPPASSTNAPPNHARPSPSASPDSDGDGDKRRRYAIASYPSIRARYAVPRSTLVLAHGLLGFSEFRWAGSILPPVEYWRGIVSELRDASVRVITPAVPPVASIAERAAALLRQIRQGVAESKDASALYRATDSSSSDRPLEEPEPVVIIAHSMGGLDSRYLVAKLLSHQEHDIRIKAVVTIGTPHHGSSVADWVMEKLPFPMLFPKPTEMADPPPPAGPQDEKMTALRKLHGINGSSSREHTDNTPPSPRPPSESSSSSSSSLTTSLAQATTTRGPFPAIAQLSPAFLKNHFNPSVPDHPHVRYFSYGADYTSPENRDPPPLYSPFRFTHEYLARVEGPNDGLVSVDSAQWGQYCGTLEGVSHIDLINWTNALQWKARALWIGSQEAEAEETRRFNAIALYRSIADMLAKEGF